MAILLQVLSLGLVLYAASIGDRDLTMLGALMGNIWYAASWLNDQNKGK